MVGARNCQSKQQAHRAGWRKHCRASGAPHPWPAALLTIVTTAATIQPSSASGRSSRWRSLDCCCRRRCCSRVATTNALVGGASAGLALINVDATGGGGAAAASTSAAAAAAACLACKQAQQAGHPVLRQEVVGDATRPPCAAGARQAKRVHQTIWSETARCFGWEAALPLDQCSL